MNKVDRHKIQTAEYDELPEITDEMFNRAVYRVNGVENPAPRRRGPQKAPTKIAVNVRIPEKVLRYFKAEGPGWQTKMGQVLSDWVTAHPQH